MKTSDETQFAAMDNMFNDNIKSNHKIKITISFLIGAIIGCLMLVFFMEKETFKLAGNINLSNKIVATILLLVTLTFMLRACWLTRQARDMLILGQQFAGLVEDEKNGFVCSPPNDGKTYPNPATVGKLDVIQRINTYYSANLNINLKMNETRFDAAMAALKKERGLEVCMTKSERNKIVFLYAAVAISANTLTLFLLSKTAHDGKEPMIIFIVYYIAIAFCCYQIWRVLQQWKKTNTSA